MTDLGDIFDDISDDTLAQLGHDDVEGQAKQKRRKKSIFDLGEDDGEDQAEQVKEEKGMSSSCLNKFQRDRAEKNRQKALTLRQARINETGVTAKANLEKQKVPIDSGAGFFIEDEDEDEECRPLESRPAPIVEPDRPECQECGRPVAESFLLRTYDLSVCDECKERRNAPIPRGIECVIILIAKGAIALRLLTDSMCAVLGVGNFSGVKRAASATVATSICG